MVFAKSYIVKKNMREFFSKYSFLLVIPLVLLLLLSPSVYSKEKPKKGSNEDLENRVTALENRVAALEAQCSSAPVCQVTPTVTSTPTPTIIACTPTTEVCDAQDNNCNNQIDEGFGVGTACDGPDGDACSEGVRACNANGGVSCTDNTVTNTEACNFVDDNCNGIVDEGC
jgi:hypothetical protein